MRIVEYIFFSLFLLIININVYGYDVEKLKEELNNNKSVSINLDLNNDDLIAKRKILDLIKGKDKSIIYNIVNNSEIIYSYKFNGKYFDKSYNDINLKINNNTNDFIEKYFNEKLIIKPEYNGYYPKGTILSVKNNLKLNKLNIYILDNDKLYYINKIKNNNKYISINIDKSNTYIISNKKLVENKYIYIYIIIIFILIIEILIFIKIAFKQVELPKLKKA